MDRVTATRQTVAGLGIDVADRARVAPFLADQPVCREGVFMAAERAFCEAGAGQRSARLHRGAFGQGGRDGHRDGGRGSA
jgi:hypothetical protein